MPFMDRWVDPGMTVEAAWDPDQEATRHQARLREQAVMAYYACDVPRRLGQDATPADLARDKVVCRKVMRVSLMYGKQWGAEEEIDIGATPNEDLRIAGTQVVWEKWWEEYKALMREELRRVATHATRAGEIKIGNSMCNRLLNELNMIGLAFEK